MTLSLGLATQANAHSRWVVPSHSVLSGDKPETIAIDFSISNDIFHPDMPMGGVTLAEIKGKKPKQDKPMNPMMKMLNSTELSIATPKGELKTELPFVNLGRKSASRFMLDQSGTYRINVILNVIQVPIDVTLYKEADGTRGRAFGALAATKPRLPEGATDIHAWKIYNNIQTYVTRDDISDAAVKPTGEGLEIEFSSHPSEQFVGEKHSFTLKLNGKNIKDKASIKITHHNTRYRNKRNSLEPTISKDGQFSVDWKEAGLYLIEAEVSQPSQIEGVSKEIYSLYLTLEVNPE